VKQFFVKQGIEPQRISLEPASFHADLFAAYRRADIALDPFPFSGGLTSCEALWMGLPLITFPQSRVVSRQSASLLQAIGVTQTLASDEDHYVQIAKELTGDLTHLSNLRTQLRIKMQESTLMGSKAFTLQLEDCYRSVFDDIFTSQNNSH
jgi:predicted O-linked N-acetylglucosamine transferase (SPINDLY family)